jgi:hypothetical protein
VHVTKLVTHFFSFSYQVKSSRRELTTTTTFKGETGCMNAIVSCKDHDHSRRIIYDICETNEGGEVGLSFLFFNLCKLTVIFQTALQVYCRAYKQALVGQAHGLLRKARRLDALLNRSGEPTPAVAVSSTPPDLKCCYCSSRFSPAFYPSSRGMHRSADDNYWQCHRCKFMEEYGIDEKPSPPSSTYVNGVAKDIVVS